MLNTDEKKPVFPLIFLHLEKAAGTTLRQIHKRQYGEENVHDYTQGPDAFKKIPAGVKVIQGHVQFSFFKQLPSPATWITILRDPVDRIISAYNYALDTPDHFVHQYALTRTIDKFVADGMYIWGENAQMKYLCGETDLPFGKSRQEHLDQALQHLQTHFSLVGTSARFDETLILLKRMLGWNMPFYIRENESSKRVRRKDLSAKTIAVLEDHHKFSRAVYNYALDRLETAIQQQDTTFYTEVEVFKLMNPQARPYLKNWTEDTNLSDLEKQIAH
ncbi:sulfotransferase family 2 domain-containing protein, partial [bacterium]|nr:sulfotransferase family 2 domain-containing protein [bacterium]